LTQQTQCGIFVCASRSRNGSLMLPDHGLGRGYEWSPTMSDRVALVVGAGGPLGRSVAVKLAGAGFTVAGVDRNADGLGELPDGVRQVPGDATDPAVAKTVVGRVAAEVGPPRRCW
jgi:hypothetical protein